MASKDSNTHIHGFAGKRRYVIYLRLESGLMPLNWQVKEIQIEYSHDKFCSPNIGAVINYM